MRRPPCSPSAESRFDAEGEEARARTGAASAAVEASERGSRRRTHFRPLSHTRVEVECAQRIFEQAHTGDSALLTGKDATKATFHARAPGRRYLHLATHGWFAEMDFPEPERHELLSMSFGLEERARAFTPWSYCGLAFAGANRGRDALGRVPGIMTAEELAGVDLSACELAVLSACETNVGLRSAGMGHRVAPGGAPRRWRPLGHHLALEGGRRRHARADGALLHLPLGGRAARGCGTVEGEVRSSKTPGVRSRAGRPGCCLESPVERSTTRVQVRDPWRDPSRGRRLGWREAPVAPDTHTPPASDSTMRKLLLVLLVAAPVAVLAAAGVVLAGAGPPSDAPSRSCGRCHRPASWPRTVPTPSGRPASSALPTASGWRSATTWPTRSSWRQPRGGSSSMQA